MPTTTLPDCLLRLSTHLGLSSQAWRCEPADYAVGFYRRGHPERDRLRYWVQDGVVRGLAIRGHEVKNGDWLDWADWSGLEDLLLLGTDFATLKFPPALPHLKRLDLSSNANAAELSLPEMPALERLLVTDNGKLSSLILTKNGYPSLQILDGSRNGLSSFLVPECNVLESLVLCELPNLTSLNLHSVPPRLSTLLLDGNRILKELPIEVILQDSLRYFSARNSVPHNCPAIFLTPRKKSVEDLLQLLAGGNFDSATLDNYETVLRREDDQSVSLATQILEYAAGSEQLIGSEKRLADVRIWLQEVKRDPAKNQIIKLLINGNGDVGKTTLWCALRSAENRCVHPKHDTTEGIELKPESLTVEGVDFRGWDFGGQEIYQGTHRLFLMDGAVQVLVLDAKNEVAARGGKQVDDRAGGTNRNRELWYFYRQQRALGPNSQFYVVETKKKLGTTPDQTVLALERDNGVKYSYLDAKTDARDIRRLGEDLADLAKKLPLYQMEFPRSWLSVREWLKSNLTDAKQKTISVAEFRQEVIKEHQVTDDDRVIELLLEFLHTAGDLYYDRRYLRDTVILDMRWALEGIYRPFQRGDFASRIKRSNGRLGVSELFTNDEESKRDLLLNFMLSCGLCFSADPEPASREERRYIPEVVIFPRYLPVDPAPRIDSFWKERTNVFSSKAKLDFYDLATFETLVSDLGRKSEDGQLWQGGIDLFLPETTAMGKDKTHVLPAGRVKITLLPGAVAHDPAQLEIAFDKPTLRERLPMVQRWVEERFGDLSWEVTETELYKTPEPPDQVGILQVLYAEAYPLGTELLEFGNEKERVNQRVSDRGGELVSLAKPAISRQRLSDVWSFGKFYPRIIHFLGHGGEQALAFHGPGGIRDNVTGAELSELLRPIKESGHLEVVILNACYTAPVAKAVSRLGVFVVGTEFALTQQNAREFAGEFYAGLVFFNGNPEEAFFNALERPEVTAPDEYHLYFNGKEITR